MTPKPATDRKAEILEVAADLLQSRTYTGFSYQDLAERLGIRKASIHHHYATKADLCVALLQRTQAFFGEEIGKLEAAFEAPGQVLSGYLDEAKPVLLGDRKVCCPLDAFESAAGVIPDKVREAVEAMTQEHMAWLSDCLQRARSCGDIQFLGEPEDQAKFIKSTLQGARQMAQLQGRDQFDPVVRQLKRSMGLAS